MKQKFLGTIFVIIMLFVMAFPAFAYDSSAWSWTMDLRFVSGDENGEYHYLDEGNMSLSGDIWVTSKDPGALSSPYQVTYYIYESKTGFDEFIGTTTVTPYSTINTKKSVSGSWGSQDGGKYYIEAGKLEDDGFNLASSGTLVTQ